MQRARVVMSPSVKIIAATRVILWSMTKTLVVIQGPQCTLGVPGLGPGRSLVWDQDVRAMGKDPRRGPRYVYGVLGQGPSSWMLKVPSVFQGLRIWSGVSLLKAWIDPWLCTLVDKTLEASQGLQNYSGVTWCGTRDVLVWDQESMVCNSSLSRDGLYDLGAYMEKGMITHKTFHVCNDDKKLMNVLMWTNVNKGP